jgi:hypothetical protein
MESRCLPAGPENGDAYSSPAAAESVPAGGSRGVRNQHRPDDLKLSDCPARRDGCAGEGGGAVGVTRGAVRSSAWLNEAASREFRAWGGLRGMGEG